MVIENIVQKKFLLNIFVKPILLGLIQCTMIGHSNNNIVKKHYVKSAFLTQDEIELTERRMITDL